MSDEEHELIPFPKIISVSRINKFIDVGLAKLRKHYDTNPVGPEFDLFVQDLLSIFPKDIRYDVVYASVMSLVGQSLTIDLLKQTIWRLAGNIDKLKQGKVVPQWSRQTNLEWVLVKLVRAKISRNQYGRVGFLYDYRVITGSAAGLRFKLFWSLRFIRFIAKSLGFSKSRKSKNLFKDGTELVGMYVCFLFDPKLSTEDSPKHYHFHVSSACKTANKKLLKKRYRLSMPCPEGFSLTEMPCFKCFAGYDRCPAGCHPKTFTVKACPRCMTTEPWFDSADNSAICISCQEKEVLNKDE